MNRHKRYLIGLAVAVAVTAAIVALLTPRSAWVALDVRRSSLRTTPDGVAAWARALPALGIPTAARFTSFAAEEPRGAAIVLLEPVVAPTTVEVGSLLAWIRDGGTLVYSPSFGSVLSDSLGLVATLVEDLEASIESEGRLLPHRWTNGVVGDADVGTWALRADSLRTTGWVPLAVAADPSAATLAWVPVGAGGVLALAEAEVLTNGRLDSTTLSLVVTRALSDLVSRGDTVFFSEYHQGMDGSRGLVREMVDLATDSPVGRVAIDLAAVGFLLLLAAGRPFGAPLPLPEAQRRSPLEHVDALGRIYERSGAVRAAARKLVHGASRRMGMRARTDRSGEEIIAEWRSLAHLSGPADLALSAWKRDPLDLSALAAMLDAVVEAHTSRNG